MRVGPASGPLLIAAAAVLWGTTGTAQELGPAASSPETVGAVRLAVGGAALVVVAVALGRWRPTGPGWRLAALATAAGVALYQLTFFAAVSRTGVALGTVVAIGSAPILAAILGRIVEGERMTRPWVGATGLALLGVALIAGAPGEADGVGIILALGAGASYAIYATGSKRMLRSFPPLGAMAIGFGGGAVLLTPLLIGGDTSWLGDRGAWPMVLWLGIATVGVAYVLFGYGLARTNVGTAAAISLAEPLTAALLGVVLLAERPSALGWLGMAAVFAGLGLLAGFSGPARTGRHKALPGRPQQRARGPRGSRVPKM